MRNKENTAIDIDEIKNSDTSKELLQIYMPRKLKILRNEKDNALEKIKKLEKKTSYENLKQNHAKFNYYIGKYLIACLTIIKQAEKKTKKRRHRLLSYRDQ